MLLSLEYFLTQSIHAKAHFSTFIVRSSYSISSYHVFLLQKQHLTLGNNLIGLTFFFLLQVDFKLGFFFILESNISYTCSRCTAFGLSILWYLELLCICERLWMCFGNWSPCYYPLRKWDPLAVLSPISKCNVEVIRNICSSSATTEVRNFSVHQSLLNKHVWFGGFFWHRVECWKDFHIFFSCSWLKFLNYVQLFNILNNQTKTLGAKDGKGAAHR